MTSNVNIGTPKQVDLIEQFRGELPHVYIPETEQLRSMTKAQLSKIIDTLKRKKAVQSASIKEAMASERVNYAAFGMAFKMAVREAFEFERRDDAWKAAVLSRTVQFYELYEAARQKLLNKAAKGGS